jgi:predicted MPP superfamily phosphohydrolase
VTPVLQAVLFLTIVVGLWSALHLYLWRRVVTPLELSPRGLRVARAVVAVGAALVPLVFVGNRWVGLALWAQPGLWLGYLYAGLVGIALPLLWMRDLALLAARPLGLDLERRKVLLRVTNTAVGGVSAALGGYGVWAARHGPEIVEVTVPVPNLPEAFEGYRIAQITDVHVGLTITGPFIEPIVAAVNGLKPDLIAVTGDLIDGSVELLRAHVAPLASLKAPDGVYFVTGNHEYYHGGPAWERHVAKLGLTVLHNEHRVVEAGASKLVIGGVPDLEAGNFLPDHAPDAKKAFEGAPEKAPRVLLAHQPRFARKAQGLDIQLQLSGHTHGGQIFPFMYFVRLQQPVIKGFRVLWGVPVYTSKGTGYWGPPVRVGTSCEVTEITLRAA